jgi:uncharacterized protein
MSSAAAIPDQAPVSPVTNEELAGPPRVDPYLATRPVEPAERISSVDLIRGFSLMGILIMNITDFAYGFANYAIPLSTAKPVFNGPHWQINTIAWFLRWILAEGKMRALFSMLFGAGVVLLTARAESRGAGVRAADIYTRRNMWLVLFGMLHCYLIWNGDILYFYGLAALLFLFPFRNLKPKKLIWTAAIILVLNTLIVQGGQTFAAIHTKQQAEKANLALAHHQVLTEDQISDLKGWQNMEGRWRMPVKKIYKDIEAHQHGWLSQGADAKDALMGELKGAYFGFGDWVGLMLLGMAFYRLGFFSLKCSTRTYALTAIIGLGIAWSVTFWGCWHAWRSHFDMFSTAYVLNFPYDLTRVSGALGNAAVLLLLARFGVFKWLLARIAAVGQMALSNYILTSLTMKTVFVWGPWHWYGYVEYYKIYYAVAAMWIVNLAFSTIWLRFFRFGPIEWCWRSLTYWKRQPMRLAAPQPLPVETAPAAV